MMEAATGSESMIRKWMAKGADPNVMDRKGIIALHHALQAKAMKPSILLISNLRNLSARDRSGKTFLMYAVLLCSLIARGVDVNVIDSKNGYSALHYVVLVEDADPCKRTSWSELVQAFRDECCLNCDTIASGISSVPC